MSRRLMQGRVACAALSVALVSGCTTTSGGVLAVKRIDRNQFEISHHVIGSLSGAEDAKARDDQTATKFCADKGQTMSVVERHGYGGVAAQDVLVFRCVGATTAKRTVSATASGSVPR